MLLLSLLLLLLLLLQCTYFPVLKKMICVVETTCLQCGVSTQFDFDTYLLEADRCDNAPSSHVCNFPENAISYSIQAFAVRQARVTRNRGNLKRKARFAPVTVRVASSRQRPPSSLSLT